MLDLVQFQYLEKVNYKFSSLCIGDGETHKLQASSKDWNVLKQGRGQSHENTGREVVDISEETLVKHTINEKLVTRKNCFLKKKNLHDFTRHMPIEGISLSVPNHKSVNYLL